KGVKSKNDKEVLILDRSQQAFIIMNRYPYNNGHLMIAPVRHVGLFENLDDEEILDIHRMLTRALKALNYSMQPQGYNIGINQGRVAGAGVVDHVHIHCVPRWRGDTNFMPVLSETKVVSEALLETYEKIKQGLERLDNP
ncbi:HIT family hydrolase, partial [candidate division TA06 bacterium DG_78]